VQEVILVFIQQYRLGRYDRERGRLRSWLFRIAQNKIKDKRRGRKYEIQLPTGSGTDLMDRQPDLKAEQTWETECRNALLRKCMELVRADFDASTLQAFRLYALDGWPIDEVSRHLRVARNVVYISKHRVLKRLRERREELADYL